MGGCVCGCDINIIVCRCVLNWFGDWSTGALYQVGYEFTNKVDLDRSDVRREYYRMIHVLYMTCSRLLSISSCSHSHVPVFHMPVYMYMCIHVYIYVFSSQVSHLLICIFPLFMCRLYACVHVYGYITCTHVLQSACFMHPRFIHPCPMHPCSIPPYFIHSCPIHPC